MKNIEIKQLKTRKLMICKKYAKRKDSSFNVFPIVVLSGKWIKESGFKPGHQIDVAYLDRCRLLITLAREQRFKIC